MSAGVIGVDETGEITLANPSVLKILGLAERDLLGEDLDKVLPEIASLVEEADKLPEAHKEGQITLVRNGIEFSLRVRVTLERSNEDESHSYVVTLDDITQLVSAQRSAAWADVARPYCSRDQESSYADPVVSGAITPTLWEKDCRG